jgi:hypothetical protein
MHTLDVQSTEDQTSCFSVGFYSAAYQLVICKLQYEMEWRRAYPYILRTKAYAVKNPTVPHSNP